MYFTYGWPTVLQLKPRKIKKHRGFTIEDMIFDGNDASDTTSSTSTSPSIDPSSTVKSGAVEMPERVVQIQQSPIDGKYVAILTTKRLSIWSGYQSRMMLFHEDLKEFLCENGDLPVGMCWAPKTPRSAGLTLVFVTAHGYVYSFCVEKLPKGSSPMYRDCPPIAAEDTARFPPLMATYDTQLRIFPSKKNEEEEEEEEEEKEDRKKDEVQTIVSVASDEVSLKGFFVITKAGTLILISWKLEIIKQVEVRDVLNGHVDAAELTVKSIALNAKKGILAVVFDQGTAVALNTNTLSRVTEEDRTMENEKFVSFRASISCKDVTAVTFNKLFDLITVGRSNGFVENHYLDEDAQETKVTKVYSTDQWGIPDNCIGKVSCLEWSHDGRAIAAGWSKGGLCIWSFYGCKLLCSATALSHQQQKKSERGEEKGEEGDIHSQQTAGFLQAGISSLCWTASSYSILIAEDNKESQVINIDFVKSAVESTSSMHWSYAIVMMGPSSLWVLSHKSRTSLDFSWSYALVPDSYIGENWPIQIVAVDKLGKYIAASGRRGLLIYSVPTNTWKCFGDKKYEQSFECVGLCWFESNVIAAVYDLATKKYYLRIYSRTELSGQSVLGSLALHARPRFMDCVDSYVVLIFDDGSLHQCQLVPRYEDNVLVSIDIDILCKYVLSSFVKPVSITIIPPDPKAKKKVHEAISTAAAAAAPPPVQKVQSEEKPSPARMGANNKKVPRRPFVATPVAVDLKILTLDAKGRLYIKSSIGSKTTELADEVEHFWLCAPKLRHLDGQQWNMVWAYGGKGLQLWHNVSGEIEDGVKPITLMDSRGMNDEVYPVGVMPQFGAVVGVSLVSSPFSLPPPALKEGTSRSSAVQGIPFVIPRAESHPFLQCILRESIKEDDISTAKAVMNHFYTASILSFSLERLLFESYEEVSAGGGDAGNDLFQKIVYFLKDNAPNFPATVVACARKIDPSLWSRLFSVAGDVLDLFAECVKSNDLHSAGTYLPVILEIKGEDASARSTAQLLPLVLNANLYALAADILRFSCKDPEADLTSAPLKELYSEDIADILNNHARVVFSNGDAENLREFQKIIPGKSISLISSSPEGDKNTK